MIDSGLVPRGKGEKQPGEGDEIVSETAYLQGAGARKGDCVPIEEWACEYICVACLRAYGPEAQRKRVWKGACGTYITRNRVSYP